LYSCVLFVVEQAIPAVSMYTISYITIVVHAQWKYIQPQWIPNILSDF